MGVRHRAEVALGTRGRWPGARGLAGFGALSVALGVIAPRPAGAFNVQSLRPAPGPSGFFGVEGARTLHPFGLAGALWIHDAWRPFEVRDDATSRTAEVVSHLLAFDGLVTVGLPGGLDFTLHLPLAGAFGGGFEGQGGDAFRFGDLRILPRWQFVGRDPDDRLAVAVGVGMTFPTGDPEVFLGGRGVLFEPRFALEWRPPSGRLGVNLGARFRTEPDTIDGLNRSHALTLGAAGAVHLLGPALQLMGEVAGATVVSVGDAAPLGEVWEAMGGLRTENRWGWGVNLAAGFGLVDEVGAPTLRGVLGISYHQSIPSDTGPPDQDGDGFLDEDDRCPYAAEDFDGFQDEDGCPDNDNDGDGILDKDDACPNQKETVNRFEDLDGCPDEGPIAVKDTDDDGIEDRTDRCPAEPEDRDGHEDFDGCPDPDNDGDGLADGADACPNAHGGGNANGCPTRDKVSLSPDAIDLKQPVEFERRAATLSPASFGLLSQVAGVLREHPEIERLVVEGHTDRVGDSVSNRMLSQARALAVRTWLLEKEGLDPARIEAVGFGDTRPIDLGSTPEANARNRRVEFKIRRKQLPAVPLRQISVVATETQVEVLVPADQPLDPLSVGFELASKDTVLIIRLPGTVSQRYWIEGMVDGRLRRGLVHPSVERLEATEVRIWFSGRVPRTALKAAQVHVEPDGLRIQVPVQR